ncbi:uncharacterized protein MONOS_15006 [Monocercomonoides exilis]|uniref:uncharacterized protein n=1 Tax=Monocercomonoides exilis TaxID=2049356 RepID=UPI00355AADFA|nr:hypothetical protein MONOS_15006 [Monocercomonoides exilis]|eukprot:MONOS_15006.1-p1 / transcript=MONOS_15006.1 / gene=MONOS_15006 / organism=Monocercomonoides_exilis_PA203 / gene_product=unspecified product / transcript_product=unspecified product / location=Mono_scaffold01125:6954-7652(+) / protein_length=215 / sequence_SO=supercontig / SO=protein_coding / is_pseudo=false
MRLWNDTLYAREANGRRMETGRGAIGASTTLPSPVVVVVGGVVMLNVMGMKDLDKEETKAIPDEFQNEKEKRENLLRLIKLQEIRKKKEEQEERERRKIEKEEKDKNLFSSIQGILQPHRETGTPINQKENKMTSEVQQEAKESQTPFLTRERKLDSMLNDLAYSDFDDLRDELDVPCRYVRIKSEENGQFVGRCGKCLCMQQSTRGRQERGWI